MSHMTHDFVSVPRIGIEMYSGPELVSVALAEWAEDHGVALEFIKTCKPMHNGFIERFNRSYRQAVLDMYVFQKWIKEYNEERPTRVFG